MQAHDHAAHGSMLDWLPVALIVLLTLAYLLAAYAQRQQTAGWSVWRSIFFSLGSLLIAIAVAPPLMAWAHHDLVGHMVLHLLIGMFAPLAWVLAAPVTLLLRALPQAGGRRVVALLHSRFVRFVSHPVSALVLNIGGMYVLYLTPLYALSLHHPIVHVVIHLHFLLAGYLFCWTILAEPDVSPHRLSLLFRMGVLFASIATHSLLGKLMYGYGWPRGTGHSLEEVQAAAQWMYYGGDLAEVLLAVVLLTLWLRTPVERREGLLSGARIG
ncbi:MULTISPECIES: cytochrome c oxidase assembly protein [Halomonas]|uniref:Cytochrome c oxidase assembly protein n=1 Tax=Halomonas citrativorans TaxID=2742612 RepID=A0ABR9FEM9_9GAMM|nr:cytochrome c oxidase assembly protein [Halomonas citrativorans]MBE0404950.1 cytochrome c oxidase assembly protein [Halomonas citrativorans]